MVKAKVQEEEDRTIPEDTLLKAALIEVTERRIDWKDRQTGEAKSADILDWWFKVTDTTVGGGKYEGRKVKGQTDEKITNHPNNKFRNWAEALMQRELPVGAGVDTDEDLVGLVALISVSHRPYKSKQGEDRIAEEVDEVIPIEGMDDDVPF